MSRLTIPLIAVGLVLGGCRREEAGSAGKSGAGGAAAKGGAAGEFVVPEIDTSKLPPVLDMKIGAARTAARRAPDDAEKTGVLGALCHVQGFSDAAIRCFARAAELEPKKADWVYFLARAKEKAGDGTAAAAYEKALALDDKCQPARTRLAFLVMSKDRGRAEGMLRQVLEADPNSAPARFGLGQCALAAGRVDEAVTSLRQVIAMAPDYGPARRALASALKAQGKTAEAAREERFADDAPPEVVLLDPLEVNLLRSGLDLEMLLTDAAIHRQRREYAKAEELLTTAAAIDPASVKLRVEIGLLQMAQAHNEEAVKELKRALEADPGSVVAKSALGEALAATGKDENIVEAQKLFREIVQRSPYDELTLQRYVALLTRAGAPAERLADGVQFLTQAAEAHPDEPALQYTLGEVLMRAKREAEAVPHLRKAVELAPERLEARHALAVALYGQGDHAGARAEWEQVLRADPKHLVTYMALSGAALEEKDRRGAVEILERGLQQLPGGPPLANSLAWILATADDPQLRNGARAVELAQTACTATANRDHGYLDTLAAALAEAGRFDEAVTTVQRAIALATQADAKDMLAQYRERQALYEQKKPYHEAP